MKPRLLIANPNTSAMITTRMVDVARRLVGDRAEIIGATAPFGAPALETPADLETAALAVAAMIGDHRDCDAVLIAAFGDPGLARVRAVETRPVAGLGEAGLLAASDQGRRFSILTLGPALRPGILAKVDALGLSDRLVEIDFLAFGVLDLAKDPERWFDDILPRVEAMARPEGAEAVLLAGAPFAGLAEVLSRSARLPLHDGLCAGVRSLLRSFD